MPIRRVFETRLQKRALFRDPSSRHSRAGMHRAATSPAVTSPTARARRPTVASRPSSRASTVAMDARVANDRVVDVRFFPEDDDPHVTLSLRFPDGKETRMRRKLRETTGETRRSVVARARSER